VFNKKGQTLESVVIIIIIILFLGWLINEGWKECRIDSDCSENQYCTSQFECKDVPVIEKSAPVPMLNSNSAAWVVGLCLIIAALIMKWDTLFKGRKIEKNKKAEYVDLTHSFNAAEEGLYEDEIEKEHFDQ